MFKTIQAKLAIAIGLISILFSSYENLSLYIIILQLFGYYIIAKNAECLVNGKCYMISWASLIIPLLGVIFSLMYKISYFKKYEKNLDSMIYGINKINEKRYKIRPSINVDYISNKYARVINLNNDLTNTKTNDLNLKINEGQIFSDNSDDLNDIINELINDNNYKKI